MIQIILDGEKLKHTSKVFSGGEVQVKLDLSSGGVYQYDHDSARRLNTNPKIVAVLKTPTDIVELLMVTSALRSHIGDRPITLFLPYVPYARQDRICDVGEALSIKVFANLINSQNYESVVIWDPHSDVTTALINNVKVVEQWQFLYDILAVNSKKFVLVAPDAGALKKVSIAAKNHSEQIHGMVRADKTRDIKTGAITDTKVYSEHIGDKSFLILDDICDGGRTFNELAKVLRPLTNSAVHLYVTHGIFSYGFNSLRENIDHIWVGHSFVDLDPVADFVKTVKAR